MFYQKVIFPCFFTFYLVFIKDIANGLQYSFKVFLTLKTSVDKCFVFSSQWSVEVVLKVNDFS